MVPGSGEFIWPEEGQSTVEHSTLTNFLFHVHTPVSIIFYAISAKVLPFKIREIDTFQSLLYSLKN